MWTQVRRKAIMGQFRSLLTDKGVLPKALPEQTILPCSTKLYNKLEDNYHLANKKALFINMKNYYEAINEDPYKYLPVTYHVKTGVQDPEFLRFKVHYDKIFCERNKKSNNGQKVSEKDNIWIIKPGENTNKGHGIEVAEEFYEIKEIVEEVTSDNLHTCIVQKYIAAPLLINQRKFDIRTYALMTSVNGNLKGFTYEEGYLRTSSVKYSTKNLANRMTHLTNDAVQKCSENYGKFEAGNKLSYDDFQRYLDRTFTGRNICFERDILPQIKKITTDCFRAVWGKIDPSKRTNTFEIYGLDFMLDEDFKVYLIEVNTNPDLSLGSPLLARLIPSMLDNTFQLVVDPVFPPPPNFTTNAKKTAAQELCPENKFELVFDEKVDGMGLSEILKERGNVIIEMDSEDDLSEKEDEDE